MLKLKDIIVCGIKFKNPILLASGTASFGEEISKIYDLSEIGGIVLKTITLKERYGNEGIRIVETIGGMLNSIGLANPGIEKFIRKYYPRVLNLGTNVICSISGETTEEFVELTKIVSTLEGIQCIELNLSCPNIKEGGKTFDRSKKNIKDVVRKVKRVSRKPIWVKLSPNTYDIVDNAIIAEKEGADCISAINTILGMKIDIKTGKPIFNNVFGGLSGPSIKPIALRYVYEISRAVKIPVIGIGGIATTEDVIEFIFAGAKLVQLGSINFISPLTAPKIAHELKNLH